MRTLAVAVLAVLMLLALKPLCAQADEAQEEANIAFVQQLLGDLGTGDMEAFAGQLAENVRWQAYGFEEVLDLHTELEGRDAVLEWFGAVSSVFQEEDFGADEFFADGDTVIVLGHESGTAIPTGLPYSENWVALLTVENGQVSAFRLFDDSGQEAYVLGLVEKTSE